MEQRSTWESIKTLVSPKTIPFLISQGVVPKLFPVGTLLLGMVLAFLWAYLLFPVVFTNAEPVHLSEPWKKEYVRQVAYQFQLTNNEASARDRLSKLGDAEKVLGAVVAENTDQGLAPVLKQMQDAKFAVNNSAELGKVSVNLFNSNLTPILCIIATAILFGLPVVVNTIIPISLLFQPKSKEKSTVDGGQEVARRKAIAEAKKAAATAPPPAADVATIDLGTPVGQYMSSYILGDDFYDDSFAIETSTNEFLGETGAGISKTIGVGDPKKVTATEVWVFDKNDIRTVTKVLMSEHAFNDEGIKAELAPKGEAVMVSPGQIVTLETQTLIIQARIVDLAYGSGSLPPNSFFERLSVEISAWPKKDAAGSVKGADAFGDTGAMR